MELREILVLAAAGILFCLAITFLLKNAVVIEDLYAALSRDTSIVVTEGIHYGCIG